MNRWDKAFESILWSTLVTSALWHVLNWFTDGEILKTVHTCTSPAALPYHWLLYYPNSISYDIIVELTIVGVALWELVSV